MKKIILIIILFLTCMVKVKSLEFSEWSEFLPNEKNNIIESEVRYKWYKNTLINSVYELYNINHNKDYNLNDFIYTDYKITNENPEEIYEREIIKLEEEKVLTKEEFNTIIFNDFDITGSFTFDGIKVLDKNTNENIEFTLNFKFIDGEEIIDNHLINNKLSYYGIEAYNKKLEYVKLDFEDSFNLSDIILKVYYRAYNTDSKKMNVYFKFNDNYYTKSNEYYMNTHSTTCLNGYCLLEIKPNDNLYILNMFKYRDKLYKYNVYEKIYKEGYHNYLENYEKDISTTKVFYRYKENELCIENEIIGSLDNKIAYVSPSSKSKVSYNYILIFIITFLLSSITAYYFLLIIKKMIKKCHLK